MIFDILQTRDGFLWVATKDGLNRYDGYNFNLYSHNPLDSFSLAEDNATDLFEDSRGLLWVGLESKGIDVYDPRSGLFHHCPLNFEHDQKPADFDVYAICEAADGAICLFQKAIGMVRVAVPEGYLTQGPGSAGALKAALFPASRFAAPMDQEEVILTAIRPQPDGSLLVYTNRSAYRVEAEQGTVEPLALPVADDFWAGLPFGFAHCRNGTVAPHELPALGKVNWATARSDADGSSWLSVNNKLWRLKSGDIPDFSTPEWVVDQDISVAMTDRNGNIWVGTQGYGLRKFKPKDQRFNAGATGNSISGLWRDIRGKYYCKVVNELFAYAPLSKTLSVRHAFPQGPDRVLDMCIAPDGDIWLLGRDNEENELGTLQRYSPDATLLQTFQFTFKSYVYARLLRSHNGHFWITGMDCQLARFNPASAQFDYFSYASLFGETAQTVRALALAEDGNGRLWIGTQEGLVHFSPQSFDFKLMQVDLKATKSLSHNVVLCLLPDPADPKGALWVGTKGGGINRLDLKNGQVRYLMPADGLPDKVVYGILPGREPGEFWCSTNRGLAKISLPSALPSDEDWKKAAITTYTAAKDLQDNEFNTQAFFKASNGEVLFGGVNGLNRFFPEAVRPDTFPQPVFIVGLEVNHAPATSGPNELLQKPLEYLDELHLRYDQNNLSFEFATLDFTDPAKNRYRYRLEGLDPDWVETGSSRFAHFNHLAAGRYTFRVQGNNGEGSWWEAANTIAVVIHPPWWRSNLAYLFYLALLVWVGWRAYQFQIRRVKEREQLAFEHRETERVKAMEQMKTDFFSNVTHEFRTPLTLMLEPLRRALPKITDSEARENVRLAEANSRKLLGLVNQLLDMAKLESSQMTLDLRRGDLDQTLRDVFERFLPLAEKRGVKLKIRSEDSSTFEKLKNLIYDAGKTELVLNNLISNALKFTPTAGQVVVSVNVVRVPNSDDLSPSDVEAIEIRIADTGIGIAPENMGKIFERFYQVDDSNTKAGAGTGIGLALSKELAELMGGGIQVESELEKGSVFTFWIPASAPKLAAPPGSRSNEAGEAMGAPLRTPASLEREPGKEAPLVLLIEDNA
ncbi:MAG: hypothetical protein H6575_14540, partial [Lewinellaceae bacterium]|nr:hypothetical protein [Lewinellaceae bacterium]